MTPSRPAAPGGSPTRRRARERARCIRRSARALRRQPGAPAQGRARPHRHSRGRRARAAAAAADRLLPARQGAERLERQLLHDRSDRQHVLRERPHRRRQERDPRHDRDRGAGLGDLDPGRHLRGRLARRVRPPQLVRADGAVLRGRSYGCALDPVRAVHLHRVDRRAPARPTPATRARWRCRC